MLFFLLVFLLLFSLFLFSFSSFFLFCSDPSAFFVILILNRHRQGRRKADRQEVQVLLHNQLCNVIAHSLRQFLINLPSEREEGKMSVESSLECCKESHTALTIAWVCWSKLQSTTYQRSITSVSASTYFGKVCANEMRLSAKGNSLA